MVTGFIAATPDGETTTLGRGGSDYTASLLGAALGAEAVELWTDVDGVMSADPRLVPSAHPIPRLSYQELMELSHFGAKVVFPPSVHPTRSAGVPLLIKNTFNPAFAGTRVEAAGAEPPTAASDAEQGDAAGPAAAALPALADPSPLCGISSIHGVALLRLEGDGMVGVPGIAMRLFGALAREGISVILISQASSEHSICFAVEPAAVGAAAAGIGREFALERAAGLIDELVVERDLAVIAAVGAAMRERPGIAGRLFGVLGDHGINVRAVAQGSSERNISLVVARADEARAVRAIHEAFFFPGRRTVEIALAGAGRVGGELLAQIAARRAGLERESGLRLVVTAVAGRGGRVADPAGLDPATAAERLRAAPAPGGVEALIDDLVAERRPLRVFVDCTASAEVAAGYERLLAAGVAVVTANKLRPAGPLAGWRVAGGRRPGALLLRDHGGGRPAGDRPPGAAARDRRCRPADRRRAVGDAGLSDRSPRRRRALVDGGGASPPTGLHRARPARGPGRPRRRQEDPHPLPGGRFRPRARRRPGRAAAAGRRPRLGEPRPRRGSGAVCRRSTPSFAARWAEAAGAGRRLRYLASFAGGRARVGLEAVGPDHPCYGVAGTDNLIAIQSERYRDSPLVVRGAGAGPTVTAAGVFADILRAVAEWPRG